MTEEEILNRMDQTASGLQSMRSTISQKKWTDILEEFDAGESGIFQFLREDGGIFLRKEITQPVQNTLILQDGKVLFYQPKIKQVQSYDLGQRKDRAEFLLIGFGSDKTTLRETYDISLIGKDSIDGQETYQLELVPKSDRVSAYFTRIILWVDTTLWIPIQQRLIEPTDDYLLIRFGQIELNPKLKKEAFELKLPKDVTVVGG